MKPLRVLLALAYPFLVFGALRGLQPRAVAAALAVVLLLRAVTLWRRPQRDEVRRLLPPAAAVAAVLLGAVLSNDERFLLVVPTLMNAVLFVSFARTLFGGPTLVETLARLQVPDLPEVEVRYCRSVTLVWCVFFVVNGGVALWLALARDLSLWTLYTGLVSYLLVGLLFAVEFVVRSWRFGRYEGTLVEPLFRRLFPQGPAT
jgi:uncharacterized membrane protein